ncbi:MAG TPA: hypothetical protein VGB85_17600 [Nannocystis sp.]
MRRLGVLVLGCMTCGPTSPVPADSDLVDTWFAGLLVPPRTNF